MVDKQLRSAASRTSSKDTKNIYRSSKKHLDRNSASLQFSSFYIQITRISTVKLLLESDEADVVQKALHHLDKFALLGNQQLRQLHENGIFESIIKLCHAEDFIVKRFSFKLLVQLVSNVIDCKQKLIANEEAIQEARNIFTSSSDDVLVEYSSILLHTICDDPKRVDALGRDEIFLKSAFDKLKSHDADILLHSIRLLNVLMRNAMLIESILMRGDFPLTNIQIELRNEISDIRIAALESLLVITSFEQNPFWELLGADRLIETIYSICAQEEVGSMQKTALMVFKNLCKNRNILLKLSQSDYLLKFLVKFTDKSSEHSELYLDILMEFATIDDNQKILCENGIVKEVTELLTANGSSVACDAVIKLSSNIFCLSEFLSGNVYSSLINVAMNDELEWSHRTLALTAMLKLVSIRGLPQLLEMSDEIRDAFVKLFATCSNLGFLLTAVSILFKLSEYHEMKPKLAEENLTGAIFRALKSLTRWSLLTTRLLNLTAIFMDQPSFQKCFVEFEASDLVQLNLKSPSSHVRAATCNLISASVNFPELCEIFIRDGILKQLTENFDCPLCSDAFETILNHDLSVKLAVRCRLDVDDKITTGFYATKGKWIDVQQLRDVIQRDDSSPVKVVYIINFDPADVKLGSRSILPDPNLLKLLEEIKSDSTFATAELHDKIKRLAMKVSKFFDTDDCVQHQLQLHLTELKFKFSSTVIPIGSLIRGSSFESALLFKALADQLEIDASLHVDDTGKGWNRVCLESNVVDLLFDVGELYDASSVVARKYLLQIS